MLHFVPVGVKRHIGLLASFEASFCHAESVPVRWASQLCARPHVRAMRAINARVLEHVGLLWCLCKTVCVINVFCSLGLTAGLVSGSSGWAAGGGPILRPENGHRIQRQKGEPALSGFTLLAPSFVPIFRAQNWTPVRGRIPVSWAGAECARS